MTDQEVGAPTVNVTDGTASLLKAGRGIARRSRIRIRILHLHPRSLSAWADTDGGGTLGSRKLSGHPLDASLETGKGDWQSDNSWWRRMVEMSQW